jgi:segregation and condensation protein A
MDGIVADRVTGLAGEAEGRTPLLALDGYNGPLERLLTLARAHQVDLARLSLPDLVDQLAAALRHAPPAMPLGQKGDWVVMASWLLQLRSLLLLPADTQAHRTGEDEADRLRDRLVGLQEMQALAGWLDRRPQLGCDVFVRGQPEMPGISAEAEHEIDVIEFLWVSLALFDDDSAAADAASWYLPRWLDLHSIPDARARILRLLAENPEGHRLDQLLPEGPDVGDSDGAEAETQPVLRRRSAWTSTFIASLELARQGGVVLAQEGFLTPIHVSPASAGPPA